MKPRRPLVIGMIVGAVLTAAPVLGMLGMVHGLTRASHALEQSGVNDPRRAAAAIGETLLATASGLALGMVGLALFIGCLIAFLVRGSKTPSSPQTPPPLPPAQ